MGIQKTVYWGLAWHYHYPSLPISDYPEKKKVGAFLIIIKPPVLFCFKNCDVCHPREACCIALCPLALFSWLFSGCHTSWVIKKLCSFLNLNMSCVTLGTYLDLSEPVSPTEGQEGGAGSF